MAKKKFIKKESKYDVFTVNTHVLSLEKFEYPDNKIKQVFACANPSGKPIRCIYWQQTDNPTAIMAGDEVILTGRMKNEVFLVYKLLYDPQKRTSEQKERIQNE